MSITIRIPAPLRSLTGNSQTVEGSGASVRDCIDDLEGRFAGLKARICDDSSELRRFINIYVNGEDIRFLSGLQTPVKDGDELSIVPAVAGG
ncbi:MAG: MoaD/ThiS family protein [Dehalococcoidia bacterium]|nr:MoaD/ThiS family protein [Dehalococcoidia bacterium]